MLRIEGNITHQSRNSHTHTQFGQKKCHKISLRRQTKNSSHAIWGSAIIY